MLGFAGLRRPDRARLARFGDDAHALDAAGIGGKDLELEALERVMTSPRTGTRSFEIEQQPAERVDVLDMLAGVEIGAEHVLQFGQFDPRIGDEGVLVDLVDQRAVILVVLVLDVADHGFEQILDGDEPVGAAIFVDDDGHVQAGGLHLLQQIADRHGGRHEQHLAQMFEAEIFCRSDRDSAA